MSTGLCPTRFAREGAPLITIGITSFVFALYYFLSWSMTPNQNLPVKFADDLTLSTPVKSGASNSNSTANEVQSIFEWTSINRMQLNFKKTWEMLLKGRSTKALPVPLVSIERKPLSTFQSHPCN